MTATTLDREVAGRLASHEVRYTRGRQALVGTLAGADGPMSADGGMAMRKPAVNSNRSTRRSPCHRSIDH